jgi:hypothetical protein
MFGAWLVAYPKVRCREPNQIIFCEIKRFIAAVVAHDLGSIGEFEMFGNQGGNVMNLGDDIQGGRGRVVGEEIGMC